MSHPHAQVIIEFVRSNLTVHGGVDIREDTRLMTSGLVDSFAVVSIISWVEKTFGVRVPSSASTVENFDTVASMIRLVESLRASR